VKCSKCFAICADTDRVCYSCRGPLGGGGSGPGEFASRLATALAVLGACVGPMIAEAYFPQRSRGGINWTQVHFAGVGGAVGAVLGFFLGSLFSRKQA
jgi:hypothetical protein